MADKKTNIKKPKPGAPTQRFLDIAEVRDNCVVLKDGTLRSVIMVSSINFALKSVDEQQALIQAYMQFLNGIEYPLQIVVQSRHMNIEKYINSLNEQAQTIENELLKDQIRDYRDFVSELVELGDIMQKKFYIVVPYDPVSDKQKTFWTRMSAALSPASIIKLSEKQFKKRKYEVMQRAGILQTGLTGMGLESVILDTQSLIELYYTAYNPDVYDAQKLKNIGDVSLESGF